jgi:hypothetical protein
VLIGYSACPLTRAAFEARGHEAWTCDRYARSKWPHLLAPVLADTSAKAAAIIELCARAHKEEAS